MKNVMAIKNTQKISEKRGENTLPEIWPVLDAVVSVGCSHNCGGQSGT